MSTQSWSRPFAPLISQILLAFSSYLLWPGISLCQEISVILAAPTQPVTAGQQVSVSLHFLNQSNGPVRCTIPSQYPARITMGNKVFATTLAARTPTPGEITIPAGGFVRKDYELTLPQGSPGQAVLEVPGVAPNRVVLEVLQLAEKPAELPPPRQESAFARFLKEGLLPEKEYSPMEFFKQHFFGYEPMYFIAGPDAPEGKFQLSLRYQLLNRDGPLAQKAPLLGGINFAYTQTSLWDLGQESSPFLDTSYKPELFYLLEQIDGGRWGNCVRLDLQAGLQHESDGNPEINSHLLDIGERVSFYTENGSNKPLKTSRSLNLLYIRPSLTLGRTNRFQLTLQPRAWVYVGGLSDNPDLPDFRGYADLRAIAGWNTGLQLSAMGRLGDDAKRGSLQLDLTYPLMKIFWGNFSVYLQAQYFTGYGESLLLYRLRSDVYRFGFAIYR
jgi:outer membrane phospholipase A